MEKKIQYVLYGAGISDTAIERANRERFSYIGPQYVLIYRKKLKKRPDGWKIIPETARMTASVAEWLQKCNLEILTELADAKLQEQTEGADRFLDRFEAELEAERKRFLEAKKGGETVCTK